MAPRAGFGTPVIKLVSGPFFRHCNCRVVCLNRDTASLTKADPTTCGSSSCGVIQVPATGWLPPSRSLSGLSNGMSQCGPTEAAAEKVSLRFRVAFHPVQRIQWVWVNLLPHWCPASRSGKLYLAPTWPTVITSGGTQNPKRTALANTYTFLGTSDYNRGWAEDHWSTWVVTRTLRTEVGDLTRWTTGGMGI